MTLVPESARAMLSRMINEFHQDDMKQQAARDKANKNYRSTIFEKGLRRRYWEVKPAGSKQKIVRFAYTVTTNATGCYLSFTETITGSRKMKLKRERIFPHDTRREAKAWALKEYRKFIAAA